MEIEKGKPPPLPASPKGGRPAKYPWDSMEVGDSFVVAEDTNLRAAAHYAGKRRGQEFRVRKDGDGFRCWRVS